MTLNIIRQGEEIIFSYDIEIDEDEARDIQAEEGYHPNEYGFFDLESGDNVTQWRCFATDKY